MGERTEHPPGTFSWTDLATTDPDAAKAFYTALLGWEPDDHANPGGGVYTFLRKQGLEVAALHGHLPEGAPPNWTSYVTVEDADAVAKQAGELGARTLAGPFDVGRAGRMAVLQDPQGAVFAVWEPRQSIGARLVNDPGALCMNQLNVSDRDVARSFYEGLFGWRFETVSEGPHFEAVYNGDRLNAGLMDLPPDAQVPSHWLVYFTVENLDDDAARIAELGGVVVVAPTRVPAGRFLVARDPQGAHFALFEGEVDP